MCILNRLPRELWCRWSEDHVWKKHHFWSTRLLSPSCLSTVSTPTLVGFALCQGCFPSPSGSPSKCKLFSVTFLDLSQEELITPQPKFSQHFVHASAKAFITWHCGCFVRRLSYPLNCVFQLSSTQHSAWDITRVSKCVLNQVKFFVELVIIFHIHPSMCGKTTDAGIGHRKDYSARENGWPLPREQGRTITSPRSRARASHFQHKGHIKQMQICFLIPAGTRQIHRMLNESQKQI